MPPLDGEFARQPIEGRLSRWQISACSAILVCSMKAERLIERMIERLTIRLLIELRHSEFAVNREILVVFNA